MKRFSFSGLRLRLILLVLIAVIPAWVLMFYTALEQRRLAGFELQKQVFRLANLAAREEERWIEGSRQILIALGQFARFHYDDPVVCKEFFDDLLGQFRRYANFGVIRPNGEVFVSAVPLRDPANAADRVWFQRTLETRGFTVGDYQIGRITGKPVLVVAQPLSDPLGQTMAVVFAALDLEWLGRLTFEVEEQLPEGSILTQLDHSGIILARRPDPKKWIGKPMPEMNLVTAVQKKGKGLIEARDSNGVPCFYAFTPLRSVLKGRDVYLILEISKEIAFDSVNRTLILNLLWLAVVVAIALIAVWFGSDRLILGQVEALVQATKRLAAGDLSARTGLPFGQGELNQLAISFDAMAAALEKHETERKHAEDELRRSRQELRNLSLYLQTTREEERTRIAREIHDTLGQAMTALKMDLSWLEKRLDKDQKLLFEKSESMSRLIDVTMRDVQKISTELRPGVLDDLGLTAAIEWEAEQFRDRTEIQCEVTFNPDAIALDKDRSTAIFRIFQETLTNVMRHANATKVEVGLEQRGGKVILEVKDNGRGIKEKQITDSKSLGLIGIRERVRSWGGKVAIVGIPDEGTRITISIPLDERENLDDKNNHRR